MKFIKYVFGSHNIILFTVDIALSVKADTAHVQAIRFSNAMQM